MKYSCVQWNDLPDEILMIILKNLTNAEVLYSLLGVNKRLNNIAVDPVFTNNLSLVMSTLDGLVYSLPDPILDRFCLHILPKIHQNIEWLHLQSRSMERFLRATNFPNLYGISLHNIQAKTAIDLFTEQTSVIHTLKNQLLSFTIDISIKGTECYKRDNYAIIFNHILTMFTNLQYLNFGRSSIYDDRLFFCMRRSTVISTNLLELHVSLHIFDDCLYLLDGHFNQLRSFYVDVCMIFSSDRTVNNTKELPSLKCFCLHCKTITTVYDELVVPLLHRMSNLEKLDLSITVRERKTVFDGNDLKMNIINYMPKLNNFTFNIHSLSSFYKKINLSLNQDIQKTFRVLNDKQIIYWTDYFPKQKKGHCHIYSCPYKLNGYNYITNNFPGGIFKSVREVSLFDERPFEHEFFLQIAQSFPFLEKLCVRNYERQMYKECSKSINGKQHLSIIKYPYLKQLNIICTCKDYHEQFLFDTKTCLPFDVRVSMYYKRVKQVTCNFTSNRTRNNCAKMNYVNLYIRIKIVGDPENFCGETRELSEHIKSYFPRTQIDCLL
ncbi:unnamed protein product [Rotaria sp. Silwood1]|nr:unnamed protein product [Rotaria sp. Silwood1]